MGSCEIFTSVFSVKKSCMLLGKIFISSIEVVFKAICDWIYENHYKSHTGSYEIINLKTL